MRPGLFLLFLILWMSSVQAAHSILIDLQSQDSLRATGESLNWSISSAGIGLMGSGITSMSWRSWDESGVWAVYTFGNFSVVARQGANVTRLINESKNETEDINSLEAWL